VQGAPDGRLRASLVDVLVAADVRGGGVRELYAEMLADSNGQVRLSAFSGLEQLDGPRDARYLELAARLLADRRSRSGCAPQAPCSRRMILTGGPRGRPSCVLS